MTEKKPAANDKKTSNQEDAAKALSDKKTEQNKKPAAKAKQEKAAAEKSSQSSSPSNVAPYLFIIIVFTVSAGGLYFLWKKQQQDLIALQNVEQKVSALSQQQQQAEIIKQQLLELSNSNQEKINAINNNQEGLYNNLSKLVQDNKQLRKDWLMAEAEYLIQIANYRILLEQDIATATVALQAADTRLAEVADPSLLNIRKVLAKDIQALKNIKPVDLAGLSVKISAMENNIKNLPLNTPDPKSHKAAEAAPVKEKNTVKSLKDLPAAIWNDIKNLVVVRNHEKPLQALLAPSQHFFLEQNLALTLEQARLALLHGDNVIFQDRLQTVEKWINEYFDTDHNVSRNMLASITELRQTDIDPELPDISSSFALIKEYRLQGQQPKKSEATSKE